MGRALYLDTGSVRTVQRDGRALRVRAQGAADRLYPLARVAHVLCRGPVPWQIDAMLACADSGVPVTFISGRGELRARLLPPAGTEAGLALAESLEHLLELPDGPQRYHRWVRSRLRAAVLETLPELARGGASIPPAATLRRLSNQRLRRHVRASALERFDRNLRSLLTVEMEDRLRREGLDVHSGICLATGVRPAADLARITAVHLLDVRHRFLKRLGARAWRRDHAPADPGWKETVAFFESTRSLVREHGRRLILHLHRYAIESRYDHGQE